MASISVNTDIIVSRLSYNNNTQTRPCHLNQLGELRFRFVNIVGLHDHPLVWTKTDGLSLLQRDRGSDMRQSAVCGDRQS